MRWCNQENSGSSINCSVLNKKKKRQKRQKKYNCTIHLLIFSYERNTMQSILWLFVVSISQNVFFDSFANERWIVHPEKERGLGGDD